MPALMEREQQLRPASSFRAVDSALPISDQLISKWRFAQSRSRLYRCAKCSAAAACPQSQPALLATKPNTTSRTIRTRQPIPSPVPVPMVDDGPFNRSALRVSVTAAAAESSSGGRRGACSCSVTSTCLVRSGSSVTGYFQGRLLEPRPAAHRLDPFPRLERPARSARESRSRATTRSP
jgi:hypothetical protein